MSTNTKFYPVVDADDSYWYTPANGFDAALQFYGFGSSDPQNYHAHVRFANVTIPKGSVITAAHVTFVASHSKSGALTEVIVYANDVDDAANPTDFASANALVLTTACVHWTPAAWTAGTAYDTDELKTVIQEIISRAGWVSGQHISIVIKYEGLLEATDKTRNFAGVTHASYGDPELDITYEPAVEVDCTGSEFTCATSGAADVLTDIVINCSGAEFSAATSLTAGFGPSFDLTLVPFSTATSLEAYQFVDTVVTCTGVPFSAAGSFGGTEEVYIGSVLFLDIPMFTFSGSGDSEINTLKKDIPFFTISASGLVGETGELVKTIPMMTLSAYGAGTMFGKELPFPTISASGYNGAIGSLAKSIPKLSLSGNLLTGEIGSLEKEIPAFTMDADASGENTGTVSRELPLMKLSASGFSGSVGTLSKNLPVLTLEPSVLAGGVGSLASDLPFMWLWAKGRNEYSSIDVYKGIAMNVANTGVTEYDNFNFNSFAVLEGKQLAAGDDGIYQLQGGKDAGADIDADFCLDYYDFYNQMRSIPRIAYISCRAADDLLFNVYADESDEASTVTTIYATDNQMKERRAKIGKGIKGRVFAFEIENTNGCDFDVREISVPPEPLQKRVR